MCVCVCMANQLHMLKTSEKKWEGWRKVSRIKVAGCEIDRGRQEADEGGMHKEVKKKKKKVIRSKEEAAKK